VLDFVDAACWKTVIDLRVRSRRDVTGSSGDGSSVADSLGGCFCGPTAGDLTFLDAMDIRVRSARDGNGFIGEGS
jgi:hypothetical protein